MSNVMFALQKWSHSLGRVTGLTVERRSKGFGFGAFVGIVQNGLMPLATYLEKVLDERVLKILTSSGDDGPVIQADRVNA